MSELNQVQTKLLNEIRDVLMEFPFYWANGELIEGKLVADLRGYKTELIQALLANDLIKKTYSLKIEDNTVFKLDEFVSMLRFKQYWGSDYTKYANDIGLTSEGKYINYNEDVVLDFPYKDSILEGGMTKEDVSKKEVFYHNILAKEEIDTLLAPKVLTNMKKYDEDGEHEVTKFKDTDNLILKGNNLIALRLLKERYYGKVKLIYIDPPYNTKNDSFKYNDNFSHSTWLTFMKNRLSVARDLLREDGVIFINTDEVEQAYLKVLCDEIFGRNNFIGDIIWKKRRGGGNDSHYMALDHDYIAVYAKNKSKNIHINKWRIPYDAEYLKRYSEYDEEMKKRYYWDTLARDGLQNPIVVEIDLPDGTKMTINSQKSEDTILKEIKNKKIRITQTKNGWSIQHKVYQPEGRVLRSIIDEEKALNGIAKEEMVALFGSSEFSNPKPEKLLSILINMVTKEGDCILDFFMGSGTTQAVAHKMGRQYIGIEQMDYINTVSVPRLQKVIAGEQGGVSEELDWSGKGSFIYAELYELNKKHVQDILATESDVELETLLDKLLETEHLNFKVDFEKLSSKNDLFEELTLEQKKNILIKALDLNQLYLNYSEIDDKKHGIHEDVKKFNHSFYQNEVSGDEQA